MVSRTWHIPSRAKYTTSYTVRTTKERAKRLEEKRIREG